MEYSNQACTSCGSTNTQTQSYPNGNVVVVCFDCGHGSKK